ncbi:tyrosine-type recombinase/integrase [Allorhizocola rhizosphaerae]|uniref:tyrosine-type recombinase/integrase n=1 Tax=Allorhizocola rhizosphaerae TaxID=1872709 RepID=UPI000E3C11B9|nr:site-specific integrase [Allorhizocola rhizosphaerae]
MPITVHGQKWGLPRAGVMAVVAKGSVFKQCTCFDDSGRRLGSRCPKLKRPNGSWNPNHGAWSFQLELPRTFDGRRRVLRRVVTDWPGRYETVVGELSRARELIGLAAGDEILADEIAAVLMGCRRKPLPDRQRLIRQVRSGVPNGPFITTGEYLTWWVEHRQIDEHTRIGYAAHVRNHLIPHLGHIPLQRLHATHIEAMFARMSKHNSGILAARASSDPAVRESVRNVRLTMPATMTRVRATLRKALNDAVAKYRLIEFNPALHLEMPAYDRPQVRVWTPKAIAQWKASGFRPSPVMVWTPEQAGVFLDHAQAHDPDLYALFLLVILAGPRRGEAVGLRADQVDFTERTVTFSHQLTTYGYRPVYKKVKTRSGDRVVFIDRRTAADLYEYWQLRQGWEAVAGEAWPATVDLRSPVPGGFTLVGVDLFFRQPDGQAWHPNTVTDRFEHAAAAAGLPPIRFHDGRHAAATYLKAVGGDLLDMKKKLGHASITVTADTYPAALDQIDRELAERTAGLVPRKHRIIGSTTLAKPDGKAVNSQTASRYTGNGVPDLGSNAPFPVNSTRAATSRRNQHSTAKAEGTQRKDTAPPTDLPAPTPRHGSQPLGGDWPPPERRPNRYPHDLR